jgi:26S proteasome regulatory subunit N12
MSVLRTYYDEQFRSLIPDSQKMYTILGLYLMYLLAYNKIAEYHTEIELIPIKEQHDNVFIRVPVALDQLFVEGSYNKILSQKQNVPHEAYQFFMNHIVDAIRFEIARSAEKAYESLKIADTYKLFMLQNEAELKQFISSNNGKGDGIEWRVQGDRLYFVKQKAEAKEIPSEKMISVSLSLATELNRIV